MIIPIAIKTVFFLKLLWHIESKLGCTDNCFLAMAKSKANKPAPTTSNCVSKVNLKNEKGTF
jgi:hypothetical protein